MATPEYGNRALDLSIGRDKATIVDPGTKINGVTVQQVPAGASALIHFGNKDGVPLVAGDSWDVWADGPDGCPVPLDEGLFLTNPIGGGVVILIVSFGNTSVGRS